MGSVLVERISWGISPTVREGSESQEITSSESSLTVGLMPRSRVE